MELLVTMFLLALLAQMVTFYQMDCVKLFPLLYLIVLREQLLLVHNVLMDII